MKFSIREKIFNWFSNDTYKTIAINNNVIKVEKRLDILDKSIADIDSSIDAVMKVIRDDRVELKRNDERLNEMEKTIEELCILLKAIRCTTKGDSIELERQGKILVELNTMIDRATCSNAKRKYVKRGDK